MNRLKSLRALLCAVTLNLSIIPALALEPPPGETGAEKARKKDSRHTAIMSKGTYAAPMSWDRKTEIMTLDGRVVAEEIYSPNKEYHAKADLAAGTTTIFRTVWQGRYGRTSEHWAMEGCHEMLGLSNDGDLLLLGCRTEDRIVRGADPDKVILTLVERGDVVQKVRFKELLPNRAKRAGLDPEEAWCRYTQLNAAGYYVIETMDKKPVFFDPAKAKPVEISLAEAGEPQEWRRHIDIFQWFEFQYPGGFTARFRFPDSELPTGDVVIVQEGGGWVFTADMERMSNHVADDGTRSTFIEFAIDRAQVMNSADGPTSSVYSDSVISQEMFLNPHGIEVLEIYLSVVRAEWSEEEESQTRRTRGPVYALLLAPRPRAPRVVLFMSPSRETGGRTESAALLKRIVQTVKYPD